MLGHTARKASTEPVKDAELERALLADARNDEHRASDAMQRLCASESHAQRKDAEGEFERQGLCGLT